VVSALYRYPVKGCAANPAEALDIEPRGPAGDRRWMILDADDAFVSQRGEPRLTALRADLAGVGIVLHAPGRPRLHVDVPQAEAFEVDVWGTPTAVQHAPQADAWLEDWLGYSARLVFQPDEAHRPLKPARGTAPDDRVSLADGYPLLMTSEASLAAVNAHLPRPAEMLRFRPNVVVRGLPAFAELGLTRVVLGGVPFRAVKPCVRCSVVTLDPATGERSKEPLRTMARLDETRTPEGVVFGMQLVPDARGSVRVGDAVEVG
jgi:uncharacterized protein YcbX